MSSDRKVILFIAMSLDGFIAQENDDLRFLSIVEREGEDYGYYNFIKSVDTVIMGRKTYDWLMTQVSVFPHADKTSYIITRNSRPSIANTPFYSGNLKELIKKLKTEKGLNIFVDGGAEIVNLMLKNNLIDEIQVSIIPIVLGGGVRLFNKGFSEQRLNLVQSKTFESGLVQLHYRISPLQDE